MPRIFTVRAFTLVLGTLFALSTFSSVFAHAQEVSTADSAPLALKATQIWIATGGQDGTGWRTEKNPSGTAVVSTLTINEVSADRVVALYTFDEESAPKGQFRKVFEFVMNPDGSFTYGDGTPAKPFMSFAPNAAGGLDGLFRVGDAVSHATYTLSGTDAG